MSERLISVLVWLLSGASALVLMELWAGLLHGKVWHGLLYVLHESHHRPREGRFEANDVLSSTHAPIAIALILYGCLGQAGLLRDVAYGFGIGMTLFGLSYLTFHDGLVHGRLPVGFLLRFRYARLLVLAHRIHHEKEGGPYGFFLIDPKLRAVILRKNPALDV